MAVELAKIQRSVDLVARKLNTKRAHGGLKKVNKLKIDGELTSSFWRASRTGRALNQLKSRSASELETIVHRYIESRQLSKQNDIIKKTDFELSIKRGRNDPLLVDLVRFDSKRHSFRLRSSFGA